MHLVAKSLIQKFHAMVYALSELAGRNPLTISFALSSVYFHEIEAIFLIDDMFSELMKSNALVNTIENTK